MKRIFFVKAFCVWFCLLIVGCALPSVDQVDVEIHNYTKQKLLDVEAWFGGNKCRAGVMGPGVFAVHVFYSYPITRIVRVVWRDTAGESHELKVDLAGIYNLGQSGVLEIGITDGGVVAKFKPLPPVPR